MQQRPAVADHRQLHAPQLARTGVRRSGQSRQTRSATHARRSLQTDAGLEHMPQQRLQQLFKRDVPTLLLERSVAAWTSTDAALWGAVPFAGQILPDLPVASSWSGLLKSALRRVRVAAAASTASRDDVPRHQHQRQLVPTDEASGRQEPWVIQTVAAQTRSQRAIQERMLRLTEPPAASPGPPAADALLCLSGSHPARKLPGSSRWLSSSMDVLRMAKTLRSEGQVPAATSMWAVENPLRHHPSRLEAKIEAGAEAIVTQPPLAWGRFAEWFEEIDRRGLTQDTKLVVGLPMLSSPGNLRFWITLCGCSAQDPDLAALLAEFEDAAAAGKPQLRTFCREWNADLLRKVKELPGVSGMHVMPLTAAARSLAQEVLL